MKIYRLYLIVFLLFPSSVYVQAQVKPDVSSSWSRGILFMDGEKVTRKNASDYLNPYQASLYQRGYGELTAGRTLLYVSGGILAAGGAIELSSYLNARREIREHGRILNTHLGPLYFYVSAGTAAVLGLTGLILCESGKGRLKIVERDLTAEGGVSQVEVDFGMMPSGVGLALIF